MRSYFFLILSCFLMICCQKREKEVQRWINNQTLSPQFFIISPIKDTTLTGKQGTRISIKANSFELDSEVVTKQVKFQLNEFYSVADFVNHRLSTKTTDGRLLKSSGMIFLQAQIEGKEVKIKENQPLTIHFPRKQDSPTANLFKGKKGPNEEIIWTVLPPVHHDTVVVREIKSTKADARGVVSTRVTLKLKIGNDTIELTERFKKDIQNADAKFASQVVGDTAIEQVEVTTDLYYIFQTSDMGWLNCDIFIDEALYPFVVQTKQKGADIFVVVDNMNSVMYPNDIKGNEYIFNLPKNSPISVVSYLEDEGKYLFGLEKINSSQGQAEIKEKPMSLEQINYQIKNLK